jgi:PmbA protein
MTRPAEIDSLIEALRGTPDVRGWRVTWNAAAGASVGVKDAEPANVYSPLRLSEGLSSRFLVHWGDGRVSFARAGRSELEDPSRVVENARLAAYEDPDAAQFAPPQEVPAVPLYDAGTAEVVAGDARPLAALLEVARKINARHGFRNYSGSVGASRRHAGVVTSAGCDVSGESTEFSYGFWFEGRAGDSHSLRGIVPPDAARPRLETACEITRRLGEEEDSFESGTMPVLLHPGVAEAFFSAYFLGNLSGERVWNRQSAYSIGQFRESALVAREDLSVRLDPHVPFGTGSFRFTSEGLASRRADYLAAGRLVSPVLDMKYARRFGLEPMSSPSAIESLAISCDSSAEDDSEDAACARMGNGLLVLGVLGLHTQDSSSGRFSLSASQSLAVRAGRRGRRVRAALSGNFFDALRSDALRLVRYDGFAMPGLLFPSKVTVE